MIGNIKYMHTSHPTGFTLLETITVVAIFSLTVTAVLNIYLIFFKNESQVERQTSVTADARFVLQSIQQALDTASVHYDYYGGPVPVSPPVLMFITPQHETIGFRYVAGNPVVEMCALRPANSPCNALDPSMWTPLNDANTSPIDSFAVWVTPAQDPFTRNGTGVPLSDEQPKVTMVLHVTDRLGENPLTLQTTLTSRAYER